MSQRQLTSPVAHLHDRLGGVGRLALGHVADAVLALSAGAAVVARVVVRDPPHGAVDVGAGGGGERGRVDGQAEVVGTAQLELVGVADHAGLELVGLALVRHLGVLAVAGAGVGVAAR